MLWSDMKRDAVRKAEVKAVRKFVPAQDFTEDEAMLVSALLHGQFPELSVYAASMIDYEHENHHALCNEYHRALTTLSEPAPASDEDRLQVMGTLLALHHDGHDKEEALEEASEIVQTLRDVNVKALLLLRSVAAHIDRDELEKFRVLFNGVQCDLADACMSDVDAAEFRAEATLSKDFVVLRELNDSTSPAYISNPSRSVPQA